MSGIQYTFNQFVNYLIRICHNDTIIFFVEDKDMDGIYERLFQILFSNKKINIFNSNKLSLLLKGIDHGGKDALEELHYKLSVLPIKTLKKINYKIIIDPDFQLYFNNPVLIKHKTVCYLNRYCIENYLINEKSIIKAIQSYFPEKTFLTLKKELDLEQWISEIPKTFGDLISYFAFNYIQTLNHNIAIVSRSEISTQNVPYFFGTSYQLDNKKIKEYYKLLKSKYLVIDPIHTKQEIHDFTKDFIEKVKEEPFKFVSGKYLFHSLFHYIRIERNMRIITKNKKSFMNHLFSAMIDNQSFELFNFLK